MSVGNYWCISTTISTSAACRPEPAWLVRLRTFVYQRGLDREIACGLPIDGTPERALRAGRLCAPGERQAIAACLQTRLDIEVADWAAGVIIRRHLCALISRLSSEEPVNARGVALAQLLVEEHSWLQPRRGPGRGLQERLSEILRTL